MLGRSNIYNRIFTFRGFYIEPTDTEIEQIHPQSCSEDSEDMRETINKLPEEFHEMLNDRLREQIKRQTSTRKKLLGFIYGHCYCEIRKKACPVMFLESYLDSPREYVMDALNDLKDAGKIDYVLLDILNAVNLSILLEGKKEVESWLNESPEKENAQKGKFKILPQFADLKPQSFSQISITITKDLEHAIIGLGRGNYKKYHYRHLGLENLRGKTKHTRKKVIWYDLLILTANKELSKRVHECAAGKISKERISKLRKFLQGITGITDEDPIPYDFKSKSYSPLFEIGVSSKLKQSSENEDDEYLDDDDESIKARFSEFQYEPEGRSDDDERIGY